MRNTGWEENKRIRVYGKKGPFVIVLHGGPGGAGGAAMTAENLANGFRVFEPWQRSGGDKPLSVAVHTADLYGLIQSRCGSKRPALVGESWGAMLALAYAAEYPQTVGPLVLVGCGTFDKESRAKAVETRRKRIHDYVQEHPEHLLDLELGIGEQIMKWHEMTDTYALDPIKAEYPLAEPFDMQAHRETWNDMLRCQDAGIYPQAFSSIRSPVIMLHGAYDPHPGKMIRDHLKQYMPHLEYHEFEKCGHAPASERYARDAFFRYLHDWLQRVFK